MKLSSVVDSWVWPEELGYHKSYSYSWHESAQTSHLIKSQGSTDSDREQCQHPLCKFKPGIWIMCTLLCHD